MDRVTIFVKQKDLLLDDDDLRLAMVLLRERYTGHIFANRKRRVSSLVNPKAYEHLQPLQGRKGEEKLNADSIRHESLVFDPDPAQAQFFDLDRI